MHTECEHWWLILDIQLDLRNSPREISEDFTKLPPKKKIVDMWVSATPREHLFQFTVAPLTMASISPSFTVNWERAEVEWNAKIWKE